MAQKQFVKIGRDLFKQKWFRHGGADVRQIYIYYLDYFITSLIGIAPLDFDEVDFDLQIPEARVLVALEYLSSHGQIAFDTKYVSVIGFYEYQRFGGKAEHGAIIELQSLNGKTNLIENMGLISSMDTPYIPMPESKDGACIPHSTLHYTTLHDTTLRQEKVFPSDDAKPTNLPEVTETERLILAEIQGCENHQNPFDFVKSLKHTRKLFTDYPTLEILEVMKDLSVWLFDNPTKQFGHGRMSKFCKNAQDRGNHQISAPHPKLRIPLDQIRREKEDAEHKTRMAAIPLEQQIADVEAMPKPWRKNKEALAAAKASRKEKYGDKTPEQIDAEIAAHQAKQKPEAKA